MSKGPQDTRTPDHRRRRENHARIDWRTKEEREAARVPEVFHDLPVFEPFKKKGKGKRGDAV